MRILLLCTLWALSPNFTSAEDSGDDPDTFVLEKGATSLPHAEGGNNGNARRMRAFLDKLPDGYKARVRFVTRAPGGDAITYVEAMTPLNAEGEADGVELHFADWYQRPMHEVPYKNGLRNGVERLFRTKQVWDSESKRMDAVWYVHMEIPWLSDKVHGTKKTFHVNGKLASESSFEQGTITGESRTYDDEGRPMRVARYKKGKKHGEMMDYWPTNGKLKRVVLYKKGIVHGVAKEFYLSGKPKWERPFKDNLQHGTEKHYDEDGTVTRTRRWKKGQELEE